jgi:hypothetical protein
MFCLDDLVGMVLGFGKYFLEIIFSNFVYFFASPPHPFHPFSSATYARHITHITHTGMQTHAQMQMDTHTHTHTHTHTYKQTKRHASCIMHHEIVIA